MITVIGKMVVNTVRGKNGPFNVASLYSEMGNYVVDYDGLDEFNVGTYHGEFILKRTELRIRNFGVSKIIDPIAYIDGVHLYNADESKAEAIPEAMPDPLDLDEESGKAVNKSKAPINLAPDPDVLDETSLKQLFGVWPLSDEVKLDPTVGRSTLRLQAAYLKSVGFKYNSTEQIWNKRH